MLAVVLTTVFTYLGQTVPRELAIMDGTGVPVPPERDGRLALLAADLQVDGFMPYATVAPTPDAGPSTAYGRVLIHPRDRIRAWAIDIEQDDQLASYVELTTEFGDGTIVSTTNHLTPPIFETLPHVRATHLPGQDVVAVLTTHREQCASISGIRMDPAGQDPVAVAQAQNAAVLEHQAECGVLKRKGEAYGFTFKGARRSVRRVARAG